MGLDGKIYRLEFMRDYYVAKTCVIKDTCCIYDGGLPCPLRRTIPIFALKSDFSFCKPEEIQMQRITVRLFVQESDLTVV